MHTVTPTAAPRRIIREHECRRRTGVHQTTRNRWEARGLFPRRVVLGPNCTGWYEDEVEAWLASRPRIEGPRRPSPNPKARRHAMEAVSA